VITTVLFFIARVKKKYTDLIRVGKRKLGGT
jgi:hypothetical protein